MRNRQVIKYIGLLIIMLSAGNAFGQVQTEEVTTKYFPNPDIIIPTPAFSKDQEFTNSDEMMEFLEKEIKAHDDIVRLDIIGKSISGKNIPVLYFGQKNSENKIRIWYQGGLHGNEPAGTEAILYLVHYLLNTENADTIFNRVCLALVPMANPDGYNTQSRYNQDGTDLNRDQTLLSQPESVVLKSAFSSFSPHFAVDLHEYRPYRPELKYFSENTISIPFDVLFLPSGNLNVPDTLRKFTEKMYVQETMEFLGKKGFTSNLFFTPSLNKENIPSLNLGGSSPRSSSSSFALSNAASVLIEIRGINLGRTSFKRRVFSGFLVISHFLEESYANAALLKGTTEHAISVTRQKLNDIVLEDEPGRYQAEYPFINSQTSGEEQILVNITDSNISKKVTTRERPDAYIISPGNEPLVKNLEILGLKLEKLTKKQVLNVESYFITECDSANLGDKYASVSVKTNIIQCRQKFPKGTIIVTLEQKNANLAVEVLEPEAENGFVRYGLLKAEKGSSLPVYRYSNPKENNHPSNHIKNKEL